MMKPITFQEVLKAVSGFCECSDCEPATGVSIDSRTELKDKAFFAIEGKNFDGHSFIPQAFEKGCRFAVARHGYQPPVELHEFPIVYVDNTIKAFQQLAKYYLSTLSVKKIAVTGSTGKTTTREMLHSVFSTQYNTMRNIKNYNNEIGIPITIFMIEEEHEVVIFEMGMSDFGEIRLLADLTRPDMAVITNIGTAHIENLKSRENILKAKWEITEFLDEGADLVINGDDPLIREKAMETNRFNIIHVGENIENDFRICEIEDENGNGLSFQIIHQGLAQDLHLKVPGRHNAFNASLAAAAGHCKGISMAQSAEGLLQMKMEDKRLNIREGKNKTRIIDDTYNANPDSMIAALNVLDSMKGKRKIAVLADMLGQGSYSEEGHKRCGMHAANLGIHTVLTVGTEARHIHEGFKSVNPNAVSEHYADKQQLLDKIDAFIDEGDVILAKGSRGMEMEEVVRYLLK